MKYKIIKQRAKKPIDPSQIENIASEFELSPLSASFIASKMFDSYEKIGSYLSPDIKNLNSYSLFNNIAEAVSIIEKAISGGKKILIYGDYDCDGVCASVILYKALCEKGAEPLVYIPDRFTDGYGLSPATAQKLCAVDCSLIITVDNGITAAEEIKYLTENGKQVIITDHHNPPQKLPENAVIIDAKAEGEAYPYKEICGAATALKLAQALGITQKLYNELLLFAGIATIADIVPLKEENRIYAHLALKELFNCGNYGLKALIKICGFDGKNISASSVSFGIAPRINAAGRLGSAMKAFELFTTPDQAKAVEIAAELNKANEERKQIEEELFSRAEEFIGEKLSGELVLFANIPDAHEGVIGIVAGRLTEKYNKPAVVCAEKDGIVKGSARSIIGFDIYEALNSANELYIKFGGHEQAAGFSIKKESFDELVARVNEYARNTNLPALVFKRNYYDVEATEALITTEAVNELDSFAPFGVGNPKPVYLLNGVSVRNIKIIGQQKNHVKFNAVKGKGNYEAIAYNMSEEFNGLDTDLTYDILFTPSFNNYMGVSTIQLEIKAIDIHIDCPAGYYESLYEHFCVNPAGGANISKPNKERILHYSTEKVLLQSKYVFIIYGKDTLVRAIKYAAYNGVEVSISYGDFNGFKPGYVNLFVNPVSETLDNISQEIIVLDRPCFSDYETRYYENNEKVKFLVADRYVPDVFIDRDYVAFVYKKLPMLKNLDGNLQKFCDFLNTESKSPVNYFSLRICLDIMSDMDIIDYVIGFNKLSVSFKPVTKSKDINKASVMIRLRDAYM